jgi:hypothetical protein
VYRNATEKTVRRVPLPDYELQPSCGITIRFCARRTGVNQASKEAQLLDLTHLSSDVCTPLFKYKTVGLPVSVSTRPRTAIGKFDRFSLGSPQV